MCRGVDLIVVLSSSGMSRTAGVTGGGEKRDFFVHFWLITLAREWEYQDFLKS